MPDGTFRVFIPVHHQRKSSLGFLSAQAFFKAALTRKFITEPIERAPSGQSETHLIQEMHRDLSTLRRLPAGIAPTGQAFAQTPQPVHFLSAFGFGPAPAFLYGLLPGSFSSVVRETFCSASLMLRPNDSNSSISALSGRPAPYSLTILCSTDALTAATTRNPQDSDRS